MRILDPQSLGRHVDRLYRAALGLCGSREDAEDLVQETFARVLSRPRLLHGEDDLYYLMKVLRNTFLSSRRTASRRPVTVATLDDIVAADPKPIGRPHESLEVQEVYATIAPTAAAAAAEAPRAASRPRPLLSVRASAPLTPARRRPCE